MLRGSCAYNLFNEKHIFVDVKTYSSIDWNRTIFNNLVYKVTNIKYVKL